MKKDNLCKNCGHKLYKAIKYWYHNCSYNRGKDRGKTCGVYNEEDGTYCKCENPEPQTSASPTSNEGMELRLNSIPELHNKNSQEQNLT